MLFLSIEIDNFRFNPFKIFSNLVANHDKVKNLKNKENQSFILICTKLNFNIARIVQKFDDNVNISYKKDFFDESVVKILL